MNPLLIGAVLGGAYLLFKPKKKMDVQVTHVKGKGGVPVKVVTPASPVTKSQASGVPVRPPSPPGTPKTTQKVGSTYAPPAAMTQIGPGEYQLAPTIITPTGGASTAISTLADVQRALNTLGYMPLLQEDGVNGPKTRANVKQFQSQHGLVVDGSAGPATKAALSAALVDLASGGSGASVGNTVNAPPDAVPAATAPAGAMPLAAAAAANSGPMSAIEVQNTLNRLGTSPPLKADGSIGPKSVAAIKSFQLAHGLVADGVVGPKTRAALRLALQQQDGGEVPMMASWGQWS